MLDRRRSDLGAAHSSILRPLLSSNHLSPPSPLQSTPLPRLLHPYLSTRPHKTRPYRATSPRAPPASAFAFAPSPAFHPPPPSSPTAIIIIIIIIIDSPPGLSEDVTDFSLLSIYPTLSYPILSYHPHPLKCEKFLVASRTRFRFHQLTHVLYLLSFFLVSVCLFSISDLASSSSFPSFYIL